MNQPKIALIVPNLRWDNWDINSLWSTIPYNLCILGGMLEEIAEVKIIDANFDNISLDDFSNLLNLFCPDFVAITVLMDKYAESGHIAAKICNQIQSSPIVIIGGVYPTMNSLEVINDPHIDYVIVGEGEYVLRELVLHHTINSPLPKKGIVYRDDGGIINLGHSDFIENLDLIPLPAYHLIDYLKYTTKYERKSVDGPRAFPYASIVSSRGCPIGCAFCQVESIMGRRFRPRSAENVIKEISYLKNQYGVQSLLFYDDNLLTNRQRAFDIFNLMITKDLVMPWTMGGTAVFKLDEELILLMKKSGCQYLDIAIETGSERIRKMIGKPIEYNHVRKIVQILKKNGIFVAANFMIGFPTETWDEIRETIHLAEELDLDYVKIFVVIPLRNTRIWDLCKETNSFKPGFNPSLVQWDTGQTCSESFSADDLTILRAFEWDRINFTKLSKRERIAEAMKITLDELHDIRRRTINDAFQNILIGNTNVVSPN